MMKRGCLVVVDYQKDFVSGGLAVEGADRIDLLIAKKIRRARERQMDILFTLDLHPADYKKEREAAVIASAHCIEGSEGASLYGAVARERREDDKVFFKAFFWSESLFDFLRKSDYARVELVGLVSHLCLFINALLSRVALPYAEISIDPACTVGMDGEKHRAAFLLMKDFMIGTESRE